LLLEQLEKKEVEKRRAAFKRRVKRATKEVDELTKDALKKAIRFLKTLGKRISGEMVDAKRYRARSLRALKADVEKHLRDFEERLLDTVSVQQEKAYAMGGKIPKALAAEFKVKLPPLPALTKEQLVLLRSFSADLISEVAEEARKKINTEIGQVALGVKRPEEAIDEIEKWVSPVRRKGRLIGTGFRAETILNTEVNRAFSVGTAQRAEQVEKKRPGLRKWWLTAGDERVRPSHADAGVEFGPDNPIPIEEPFIVGGAALEFPGDPGGPPEQVINCRCRVMYLHPEWEE